MTLFRVRWSFPARTLSRISVHSPCPEQCSEIAIARITNFLKAYRGLGMPPRSILAARFWERTLCKTPNTALPVIKSDWLKKGDQLLMLPSSSVLESVLSRISGNHPGHLSTD